MYKRVLTYDLKNGDFDDYKELYDYRSFLGTQEDF